MANLARLVMNAQGMSSPLYCGAMTRVGIGLSGTWVGTASFKVSYDGVKFFPLTVTPFASGTGVQTTTANGNWFADVANGAVIKMEATTLTSGSMTVVMAAATDSSWQDAFLASTSVYLTQSVSGGTVNTIAIAAQANRAWRVRTVSGGFSVAPSAAVRVTITDGASSVIWDEYVAATAGGFQLKLPADSLMPGVVGGGVAGTPGNAISITVAAPGGAVVSSLSVEAHAN